MSDDSDQSCGSITHFFQIARDGEALGVEELWRRYLPRLLTLAQQALGARFCAAIGPEDVVQSAFGTFWRRARDGSFDEWSNRDELWKLLATITVRKVHQKRRREFAAKRGRGQTRNESDLADFDGQPFRLDDALVSLPTVEFDLCCEEYLLTLNEDTRSAVVLKMMGHTNLEAAEMLGCSESTIERKLRIARKTWNANDDIEENEKKSPKA